MLRLMSAWRKRFERVAEEVAVVTLVAEQLLGSGQAGQHQRRPFVVAHLPLREEQDERTAPAVADGVELGIQAALGAPKVLLNLVFQSFSLQGAYLLRSELVID